MFPLVIIIFPSQKVKDMTLLELCLKETLRLRPPIMTMMRMVKTQQVRAHRPALRGRGSVGEKGSKGGVGSLKYMNYLMSTAAICTCISYFLMCHSSN